MVETPFFSVIIVNYNGGDYLQMAVDSLEHQTFRNFETWIVDNDSSDTSMELLDLSRHDNAQVIMAGRNTGFAEGNNIAARRAAGEWIVLLNCDATAEPDWLEVLNKAIHDYPDTAMFASTQLRMDDPTQMDGAGDSYTVYGFAWRGGYLQPDSTRPALGECFSPCGASAAYRRDVFMEVGGFEERFFCYMEDVELAFRLRMLGEHCLFLPHAVVHHKGGGLSGEKSEFSVVHGARNRVWTYVGNMPALLLILTLPMHALLTLYLLVWYARKPFGRYVWKGLKLGLADAWNFRKSRKSFRKNRKVSLWKLAQSMTWNPFRMSSRKPDVRPLRSETKITSKTG